MKLFKFNFLTILLIALITGLVVAGPSYLIQSIWNATVSPQFLERDLSIEVWQAFLLWSAVLTGIYMTGIFKIGFDLKSIDSIDLSEINDPELRDEIEKLKELEKAKEKSQTKEEKED